MAIRVAALLVLAVGLSACRAASQRADDQVDLIAFSRAQTHRGSGIFIARADGTKERPVTPSGWYVSPTWSPDGKQLAYIDGGEGVLYTLTLDGMRQRLVTKYASDTSSLAWSPDGRTIAMTVDLGPLDAPPATVLVPAEGGELRSVRVADLPAGSYDGVIYSLPAWSPYSQRLAYTQLPRHPWFGNYSEARIADAGLYTIDLDGRNRTRMTKSDRATDTSPTWLPDGKTIIFVRQELDDADLWSVRTDGTGLMQLTSGEPVTSYDVSRGGRRIAWTTRSGIYEGETDGGDQRLLVKQPASSLDWSPDGEEILFASSAPGCCADTKVYVVVVSTGRVTRLTPDKISEGHPVWRPR